MRSEMNGDIERVLLALNRAGVRYLVVGGVAVVLHGHLRTTHDLDLVIQLQRENLTAALAELEALGLQPNVPVALRDFVESEQREKWAREKNMVAFPLWNPRNPTQKLDLFIEEPIDFDAAYRRASKLKLGAVEAPVLSLPDLIAMKKSAGRPQDLADVQALERIRARRQGDDP